MAGAAVRVGVMEGVGEIVGGAGFITASGETETEVAIGVLTLVLAGAVCATGTSWGAGPVTSESPPPPQAARVNNKTNKLIKIFVFMSFTILPAAHWASWP